MTRSEPAVDPQTVQRLVLARMLVPSKGKGKRALSRAAVVKSVASVICPPLSAADARAAANAALEHCERDGLVTPNQPALTQKAKKSMSALLGVRTVPRVASWAHAQQLVALGRSGEVLGVNELAAVVLGKRQGVPGTIQTLPAVIDYLAWRELGVETSAPFTVEAVQRHLLRKLVPADVRVGRPVWRRMLAMRAAGASGHDAKALLAAMLLQPPAAGTTANTNDPRPSPQPSLADFAAAVRAAARMPTVARFYDDRAYIGSVWDHMRGRGPVGEMSLPDFKHRLIAAHRDGLLRITRADLVGAMDRREVERSEAQYQGATFHFVALEAGG